MPRPLKPLKQKWWTPPETPTTRLALTGKADPEAKPSESDDEMMFAALVATGTI